VFARFPTTSGYGAGLGGDAVAALLGVEWFREPGESSPGLGCRNVQTGETTVLDVVDC
jgi:hypothetical protein